MSEGPERSADRPKVFISYSRQDGSALADELVPGLELAGFEPFLDRHDIEKAVDWEERLAGLILKADTIVFIITPASVRSSRCQWEVDRATALAKRIIPVLGINVAEAEVPERLRRLNYTIFADGQSFARPLAELAAALRQDVNWIRTHTVMSEEAARWKALGTSRNADDILLRGSELENARAWLKQRKADAPAITETQHAFIAASQAAEDARINAEQQRLAEREEFVREVTIAKKRTSYARIIFDALFFPSRIASLIRFNDGASLWAAVLFWIGLGVIVVTLNGVVSSFYGVEFRFSDSNESPGLSLLDSIQKIFERYQIVAVIFSMLASVVLSLFWYGGIRCLVSGSKLPFLGFLQCVVYPTAVAGLLYLPITIMATVLTGDIFSKDFNFAEALKKYPQLANDPLVVAGCKIASSFQCKSALSQALHFKLYMAQMISSVVVLGWTYINIATIIKGVTGVRRRRTLGGLLISFGVAIVCLILVIIFIVIRMA